MKGILKFGFLVASIFISTSMMAKDKDFSVAIGEVSQKTLHFEVSNAKNVSLYVYNSDRNEIFSETLKNDNVEKSYNMSGIASGTYFLVAESEAKIEKYKIVVDGENVTMEKSPVSAISKPEYIINKNVVKLQMSNVIGDVKVSVFDTANNTYYSKNNVAKNGSIDLTFDLNPANPETYIINVEKDGDSFSRMISLK
ncbi:T9SS type A sorting domain-containing protein [Epilithonimonas hungarica]|uniref:Por secretion system C-terminal sorting domain-containing protein n=1 Tax=Epilithonimonas hungarica TaxID=454006 RepID=A0A1G7U890_9FLAO|nr:T9SS type A sorting domain-containing protein [Epilithonimonas hungarica]MDP9955352.1 putative membrane protein [Epilithonimonas hungarica]SDG43796.1 Por secretion system C-terminal sorting domain-containing protein [Epilithonimonas hungarica]